MLRAKLAYDVRHVLPAYIVQMLRARIKFSKGKCISLILSAEGFDNSTETLLGHGKMRPGEKPREMPTQRL
jgi:hypothetical protein